MVDLTKGYIEFTSSVASDVFSMSGEAKVTCYEELLAKAIIMRANAKDPQITIENHQKVFPAIKHIIEWLRTTDFYTAPASTKYHDACYAATGSTDRVVRRILTIYNLVASILGDGGTEKETRTFDPSLKLPLAEKQGYV